jgi:hypothetical protein
MVTILFDIGIEGRTLAAGECVSLSRSLERYLVEEGAAEYETATFDLTKLEQRDNINDNNNTGSGQLPNKHRGKTLSKGRPKRK